MITMKKIIRLFVMLCVCLLLAPMKVQATEITSEFFTTELYVGEEHNIAPGDTFTDAFTIKNTASEPIKVRVYDVDNVGDSKLYPVITASWIEEGKTAVFGSLDDLAPSEWYTVEPGKNLTLMLSMHFPEECGNEYQGATLAAKFIFESRIPKEVVGDIELDSEADDTNPKTGDQFNMNFWGMMCSISGGALLIVLLAGNKFNKIKKA